MRAFLLTSLLGISLASGQVPSVAELIKEDDAELSSKGPVCVVTLQSDISKLNCPHPCMAESADKVAAARGRLLA